MIMLQSTAILIIFILAAMTTVRPSVASELGKKSINPTLNTSPDTTPEIRNESDSETNDDTGDDESDDEHDDEAAQSPSQINPSPTQALSSQPDAEEDIEEKEPLISSTFALTTDYIFRGLSQSDHNPAAQGGFDFKHPLGSPFGIHLNIWGSNVHFTDSNATLELDTFGGVSYTFTESLSATLGALHYSYFGDESRNSWDIPLKIEWKEFTSEVSYSPHWAGDGHAWYLNVGWSDEVLWQIRLSASVGYSIFSQPQPRLQATPNPTPTTTTEDEEEEETQLKTQSLSTSAATTTLEGNPIVQSPNYFDFRLAIARDFFDLNWEIAGTLVNHAEEINGTPGSTRLILSVSKTF